MKPGILIIQLIGLLPVSVAGTQTVRGTITEQATGLPIRGVGIVLRDEGERPRMGAVSDSLGRYRLSVPNEGQYTLAFSRSGLQPVEGVKVSLRRGSEEVVNATLSRGITTLSTVSIVGERPMDRPPGDPHKYDEFLRRRAIGLGTFLTREEIHSRPRHQIQEIFNGIPGIKVRHAGTQWFLRSQRCSGKWIPGLDGGAVGGGSGEIDPKLNPMIFIDGVRVFDETALSHYSPSEVDAVEVYQGGAQMPAEARGDACFAIFVWLKNG